MRFSALSDTRDKLSRVQLPHRADSLGGIFLSGDTYDIHTMNELLWSNEAGQGYLIRKYPG